MSDYLKAKGYALKRLAMKSELSLDLKKAILAKGYPEEMADKIIDECREHGYLNDEEWVERYVDRFSKGKGAKAIAYALRSKGVPTDIIQEKLSDICSEKAALKHLLETKYAKRDLSDYKEKQKVIASLARKGFSIDDILSVLT